MYLVHYKNELACHGQDGVTDEFDVGAAADLRPPGSHMLLPLRLLDNFTLFTLAEDVEDGEPGAEGSPAEALAGLEQLVDGAPPHNRDGAACPGNMQCLVCPQLPACSACGGLLYS